MSIVHKEDSGQIVQDALYVKKPPFDPAVCVEEFVAVLNRYGISVIEGDRYGGECVSSSFQKQSVYYENSQLSKNDIYLESLPLFMQQRIELLDYPHQGLDKRHHCPIKVPYQVRGTYQDYIFID
jgi:hypothetical protein